jgi:hypothetical protein
MAAGEKFRRLSAWGARGGCALLLTLAGCGSLNGGKSGDQETDNGNDKTQAGDHVDVGFLLSMTFDEAKKMSPSSGEMPPFYKVAADEVKTLAQTSDNKPKRVRAKGRVFLEIDYRERLNALGQEALISPDEVILRGKPLLKRGRTVVEGLDDTTVFYIRGVDLKVIGKHRITTEKGVTPTWKRSWKQGPNPLLPVLTPDDVPKDMRSNPLLPPPSGMLPPGNANEGRALGEKAQDPSDSSRRSVGEPPRMREPDDANGLPKGS